MINIHIIHIHRYIPSNWKFTKRIKYVKNGDGIVNLYLEIEYNIFLFFKTKEWLHEIYFCITEETIMECNR